jgi:hypothetical protein
MILHIVLYQPKATATPEELKALTEALKRVSVAIPFVRQVRVGMAKDFGFGYKTWPYNQKSGYVAVFEFADLNDLGQYLVHDSHKMLAEMFWKTCDNPMILDVTAIDPKLPANDWGFATDIAIY